MQIPVYMDNMATTPVDPRVLADMLPYFGTHFGNASSKTHAFGLAAADAVEKAREEVAGLIGARAQEIVFTAGATEANNLAIKGAVQMVPPGAHIVTCAIEHKAVLECCHTLEQQGVGVTYLPVDRYGQIDLDQLAAAITPRTALISLMAANNEIGVLQPLEEIGRLARERGVLWHCDAAQAVGKVPLDVEALGIDLLSASGHKLYAPKGVGFLYVRSRKPRVRLQAQVEGGGQERGLRGGTLNVPGIVGLGTRLSVGVRGDARGSGAIGANAATVVRRAGGRARPLGRQRPCGRAPAGQSQRELSRGGRNRITFGIARNRVVFGRGLFIADERALTRPQSHRRKRRFGAGFPALWVGTF